MADISNLIPIGRFSSLTRISVRMLRHYDANGVLVPAEVDPGTGYRSYAPDQLADAVLIRKLRDVGFGVPAIGALLAARDTATFTRALDAQRDVLVDASRAAQRRIDLIDQLRDAQQKETTMSITIDQATFAARDVVALRGVIPTYDAEPQLWQQFDPELERQAVAPIGPCGATNLDDEYKESDVHTEVWVPVAPGTTVAEPLIAHFLPEVKAVRAVLTGPYDLIDGACDQLVSYADEKDLPITGGMRYVYLNDESSTPAAELITEIYLPIG